VQFLLKTARNEPALPVDDTTGRQILTRLRHEGRKLIEVFVLAADGALERYQERTRRKLGSNAVASRTWLCETADGADWSNGRYIPEPQDAIVEMDPAPEAVVLVLAGAEGMSESVVAQLHALIAAG